MTDHYQTLGVQATASDAEIKSAYRKLAKEFHPDVNRDPGAEARFKAVGDAYDVLKDAQKRASYDLSRQPRPQTHNFSWGNHDAFRQASGVDLDEILRDIRRQRGMYEEPPRNRDIMLSYAITLEEAFAGKEAEVSYNLAGTPTQNIKFKIQPGVQDGIKLRFQGRGDDAMAGVTPGDLYVRVNVIPHHTFVRMGPHLATGVDVDYLDALLGSEREVSTIDGGRVKLRVPAGIHHGQQLRVAGKGMTNPGGPRGDMIVEVHLRPGALTEEIRQQLEEIRAKRNAP